MKVLLIIEQCNPEWPSVPLVGYRFYEHISQIVDTTLVTHSRNKTALEKIRSNKDIIYIFESAFIKKYYAFVELLSKIGNKTVWPLYHTLSYAGYSEFNDSFISIAKNQFLGVIMI